MENLDSKETETVTNKCPSCGSDFIYDIKIGKLRCEHCGTVCDIDTDDPVYRREITDAVLNQGANWTETAVFSCANCGAKEVTDKHDINHKCAFCGSSNITASTELPGIKPDSLIPFQITKESAGQRFRNWIKKLWLAPGALKKANVDEHMNAVYTSCWSFSSHTESNYSGTLGKRVSYTRRNSQGQIITETRIDYFNVHGHFPEDYFDYLIQSGDRIAPITFNKLKPFDLKLLEVYRQEYLSGLMAEHYSRDLDTCFADFTQYVRADIKTKIMRRHNADVVQSLDLQTDYKDRKFNYILLPLYIANYTFNGKKYNFYVNGASGAVVGSYPKSKFKIALIVLGIALLVAAGICAYLFLGK